MSDITWQLNNVTFDDGGTAYGWFVTDDAGITTDFDVHTTAAGSFGAYEYSLHTAFLNYDRPDGWYAISFDDVHALQFIFKDLLSSSSMDYATRDSGENYYTDIDNIYTRVVASGYAEAPPVCYLRGTRIMTIQGEMPIEAVRPGDLVVCRFGGLRPVRWVGRQSFCGDAASDPEAVPVVIDPGALGPDLPRRALHISQGHSMLVGETFVLGRSLVNGITIRLLPRGSEELEYFQIDLDSHDCIMAEGAWSETFADAADLRARFDNAAEFLARFPEYVAPADVTLCAPRPLAGPGLDAALRPLVLRAGRDLVAGPLRAFVDRVDASGRIAGWAVDSAHPDLPVLLDVALHDRVLGTVLACDHRQDLQQAGIGRGRHSFVFDAGRRLSRAERLAIQVRRTSDGAAAIITANSRNLIDADEPTPSATPLLQLVA